MFMTYVCVSFLMVMSSFLWIVNIYSLVDSLAEFAILTTVNIESPLPFGKTPPLVDVPPRLLACLCLAVDSTTGNCQDAIEWEGPGSLTQPLVCQLCRHW
ncbi:MAG: uncharacterized protein KVP18_002974 [Porospora cf. gigantea A]|uniref:uncharacterized protein n=1 Tax=Porospora cf. gigantea A TaxID=2853593 RepID=UPI003559E55D|nr:MAG: hypothetical protein KVP18_002974 [Porospora cf. gigantea A]